MIPEKKSWWGLILSSVALSEKGNVNVLILKTKLGGEVEGAKIRVRRVERRREIS